MLSSVSQGSKLKVGGAEDKLAVITQQIHDVRAELARMEGGKSGRVYSPPTDYSKKPKKSFHHPKLDIIYGEIIYSPYLTPPLEQYPETTFTMVEELRSIKRSGKTIEKLPQEQRPFNPKWARNRFIREVVNYKVSYGAPGAVYKSRKGPLEPIDGAFLTSDGSFFRPNTAGSSERPQSAGDLVGGAQAGGAGSAGRGRQRGGGSINPLTGLREYKSKTLLAAEARGGPSKFKHQLREVQLKAQASASLNLMASMDFFAPESELLTGGTTAAASASPVMQMQEMSRAAVAAEKEARRAAEDAERRRKQREAREAKEAAAAAREARQQAAREAEEERRIERVRLQQAEKERENASGMRSSNKSAVAAPAAGVESTAKASLAPSPAPATATAPPNQSQKTVVQTEAAEGGYDNDFEAEQAPEAQIQPQAQYDPAAYAADFEPEPVSETAVAPPAQSKKEKKKRSIVFADEISTSASEAAATVTATVTATAAVTAAGNNVSDQGPSIPEADSSSAPVPVKAPEPEPEAASSAPGSADSPPTAARKKLARSNLAGELSASAQRIGVESLVQQRTSTSSSLPDDSGGYVSGAAVSWAAPSSSTSANNDQSFSHPADASLDPVLSLEQETEPERESAPLEASTSYGTGDVLQQSIGSEPGADEDGDAELDLTIVGSQLAAAVPAPVSVAAKAQPSTRSRDWDSSFLPPEEISEDSPDLVELRGRLGYEDDEFEDIVDGEGEGGGTLVVEGEEEGAGATATITTTTTTAGAANVAALAAKSSVKSKASFNIEITPFYGEEPEEEARASV